MMKSYFKGGHLQKDIILVAVAYYIQIFIELS
ncbi:transposase (plasmid) [Levilactobacillus brevis]|uniref:Transposase n=1 Tax=Levilactobacillus brevis TaxID=1580 RepID=A0A5B7Y397_LEVBR|nr:transposase [Levilactobacillus brevis]